jgi:methylated-DNA-[protein]-cysteine S-methyltransferase
VIGASGKLTGFAGGLEAKEHLLSLEGGQWSQIGKSGELF